MQSEKFDKRTREAAENHHPAYDEQAWNKMEKLLDKHLPQKEEKKRRFIFIILFFLLLGGGGFWLLSTKPWTEKHSPVTRNSDTENSGGDQKTNTTRIEPPSTKETEGHSPDKSNVEQPGINDQSETPVPASANLQENIVGTETINTTKSQAGVRHPTAAGQTTEKISGNNTSVNSSPVKGVVSNTGKTVKTETNRNKPVKEIAKKEIVADAVGNDKTVDEKKEIANTVTGNNKVSREKDIAADKIVASNRNEVKPNETNNALANQDQKATTKPDQKDLAKEEAKNGTAADKTKDVASKPVEKTEDSEIKPADSVSTPVTAKKKPGDKKSNSLMLTVSAGPDISVVGSNKAGKTRMVTGIGLSYLIKDRFSISTGFYSARKIYSAKPGDYKAPPEFYQAYPYLEKVDANCRVYEIPVSVAYHFGKKDKNSWFVSAGLSTFLMNEEGYNYFYKYTPTGNTYTNFWKVKNENAHYFSVGTFSAGYRRQLGNRVSVMAEPYVKVPFTGVGYGKVKLNSGGVLFTVGVKLF